MSMRLTRLEQQEQTRERVVAAADELFTPRGFHASSVGDIAAAAGSPTAPSTPTSPPRRTSSSRSTSGERSSGWWRWSAPLLRLEVADGVTITREPCRCGRTLCRLESIAGRSDDVLSLGGVAVHPLHFGVIARDRDVVEFQVLQTGAAAVRVLVVAATTASAR